MTRQGCIEPLTYIGWKVLNVKKHILKLFVLVLFIGLFNTVKICAEETTFNLSASVDYENSKIVISGVTPAKYRQLINVIIYKPEGEVSVPETVTDIDNPQSQFPLKSLGSIQRIENIHADIKGNFSVEFKNAEIPEGYYIVSASGGGYMSDVSKDSELMYISSEESIENSLLEISAATGAELEMAIDNLKNKYDINPGSGYESDLDKFINYFITVREEDFLGIFTSLGEVQKAFDGVNLIMATVGEKTVSELQLLYETQNDTFNIFDETDEDYVANNEAIYPILKNIAKKTGAFFSIGDVKIMFRQAQGLATINTKNTETVAESILKYGGELGLDVEDYLYNCEKYGEREVNIAFIGREFNLPEEVVISYDAAIAELEAEADTPFGGGGSIGVRPIEPDPSEINLDSYAVSSEEISYTISVQDYNYSTICVAIYSSNMKLRKIKLYKLIKQGTGYVSGEMLRDSDMKYFRVFCIDTENLEPACVSIEKRI